MIPENFLIFLQIILFMFITPGAPRILIMTQSLNFGFKKSLWTAFGDISANTLQMILVLFGLTALLKVFPNIVIYFKWAGIIYLVYIAYWYIKLKLNINIKYKIKQKSIGTLYIDGFLVAFLSPKATVFFATVFPTFLIVGSNYYYHTNIQSGSSVNGNWSNSTAQGYSDLGYAHSSSGSTAQGQLELTIFRPLAADKTAILQDGVFADNGVTWGKYSGFTVWNVATAISGITLGAGAFGSGNIEADRILVYGMKNS